MMNSIPSINPYSASFTSSKRSGGQRQARFAGCGSGLMALYDALTKTATRRIISEDIGGFGFLRSTVDISRQYIYGDTVDGERKLNWSAGRERMFREICSVITDCFAAGVIAAGLGKYADSKLNTFSNAFTSTDTLRQLNAWTRTSNTPMDVIDSLAKAVGQDKSKQIKPLLVKGIKQGQVLEDSAVAIAKRLGKETLDVTIDGKLYQLDTLMKDTRQFLFTSLKNSPSSTQWKPQALKTLSRTLRISTRRIPIAIALAMGMTFAVPYINHIITKKLDGIEGYPAELGLRSKKDMSLSDKPKNLFETYTPYMNETLKKGNIIPLLSGLAFLPIAFGLVRLPALSRGNWSKVLNLPGKNFLKNLESMFQFSKGFPFTTHQQIGSLCAMLYAMRIISSRSGIEYRERLIDTYAGWAIWMLATPLLTRYLVKAVDKNLLKTIGGDTVVKRGVEIEKLLPNIANRASKLKTFKNIGIISTITTMILLGIVEPIVAAKWSESQVRKERNRNTQPSFSSTIPPRPPKSALQW